MIVASGNIDLSKIVESIALMARDENSIHEWNKKEGPGSCKHADGWGVAYRTKKGAFTIKKSTKPIFEDPEVEKLRNIKTDFLIIHVRRKAGSEIAVENTHPFKAKHAKLGECIFCHNGRIEDEIQFDPKFKPQGKTDSERLLYSILSDIQENTDEKIATALKNNLQKYHQTKGSNIILATKDKTHVAMRKTELPRYYGLSMGIGKDFMLVSSEKLKTFPDISWKAVAPESVITMHNGSTKFTIHRESIFQKMLTLLRK